MTKAELDVLWNRALREALEAGEEFTRYRFAAMVASAVDMDAKNKANASLKVKCKEKVVAEREECAKVCDKKARDTINPVAEVFYKDCAASIRLRGHQ